MRTGKCHRCSRCCTFKALYISLSLTEKLMMNIKVGRTKIKQMLKDDFKCPYLAFKNNKAFCRIYNQRPQFCRDYPATKNDLLKNCGYKFDN